MSDYEDKCSTARFAFLRARQSSEPGLKWICRRRTRGGYILCQVTAVECDHVGTYGHEWARKYGIHDTPEAAIDATAAYYAGWSIASVHRSGPKPRNPYAEVDPSRAVRWQVGWDDQKGGVVA